MTPAPLSRYWLSPSSNGNFRKRKPETAAAPRPVLDPYPSAVHFDKGLGDGEADAAPAAIVLAPGFAPAVKAREHVRQVLLGDAVACVRNAELDLLRGEYPHAQSHLAPRRRVPQSVRDEVAEHLSHSLWVRHDAKRRGDGLEHEPDAFTGELRGEALLLQLTRERNLEEGRIRVAAVATDLLSDESVVITEGKDTSAALAGLVPPLHENGRLLADGVHAHVAPINVARSLGPTRVIAVDPSPSQPPRLIQTGLRTWLRATKNCAYHHGHLRFAQADLTLRPRYPQTIDALPDPTNLCGSWSLRGAQSITRLAEPSRWYPGARFSSYEGWLCIRPLRGQAEVSCV